MVILAIGDVVGSGSCEFLRRRLPDLRREHHVDFTIVNGENSADDNGITPFSAEHLFTSGADVITGGNHTFRRREIYDVLDENPRLLRPANYPAADPGRGFCVVDTGRAKVCVINLLGTVFMDSMASPFETADAILRQLEPGTIVIVDFHAEATSEKRALGFYLDGRVAALFGTHTHVQTADECLLPGGTGYITDLGMTGPIHSVLGVDPKPVLSRYLTRMPVRFTNPGGPYCLGGAIFDIDIKDNRSNFVKRIQII